MYQIKERSQIHQMMNQQLKNKKQLQQNQKKQNQDINVHILEKDMNQVMQN